MVHLDNTKPFENRCWTHQKKFEEIRTTRRNMYNVWVWNGQWNILCNTQFVPAHKRMLYVQMITQRRCPFLSWNHMNQRSDNSLSFIDSKLFIWLCFYLSIYIYILTLYVYIVGFIHIFTLKIVPTYICKMMYYRMQNNVTMLSTVVLDFNFKMTCCTNVWKIEVEVFTHIHSCV